MDLEARLRADLGIEPGASLGDALLAKVRRDLARTSREDADRRVVCPECQCRVRDLDGHTVRHV